MGELVLGLSSLLVGACHQGTTWLGAHASADARADAVAPTFFARHEAEAPTNALTFPVQWFAQHTTCPPDGVKEGADCASGGTFVRAILGRSPCEPPTSVPSRDGCLNIGGGVRFDGIDVPVDGYYDVTWWYHCGSHPATPDQADVAGNRMCGGLDYGTGPGSGCRSHLIDVNGIPVASIVAGRTAQYFHFPCYPVPLSILHGATTSLPLKAGSNSIYIHAPPSDTLNAADIDALDVRAPGYGTAPAPQWPRLVAPVVAAD